jgi:hypothetical protein
MKKFQALASLFFILASPLASADTIDSPATVDFGKLRNEYGARADFDVVCDDGKLSRDMISAMNGVKADELLDLTSQRLNKCPIDIIAHLYRGSAFKKLGQMIEAGIHFQWVTGLVQSVLSTGDGKTPQTAWVTISLAEERAILGFLRLRMISQTLVTNPYRDRIEAVAVDGAKQVVYFFPEAHFSRLAKNLGVPNPAANANDTK